MFVVDAGKDCEPLRLGLCKFPTHVWDLGGSRRTRLDSDWRVFGFSKTQFTSLHGWEYFRRCHTAVVDLLVALRPLGFRVQIFDEGEYWPRRSLAKLRQNIDEMNGVVAAAAGALKDMDEPINGRSAIESPIFAHKDFERLEAAGEARAGAMIREACGEVSRQVRKLKGRA